MVTFDANGVAIPAAQAFLQDKVNRIINDPGMDQFQKESKLRDLYNQYGLEYGTYNRKGHTQNVAARTEKVSVHESDTSLSATTIFTVVLIALLTGIYFADHWFVDHHIKFSIAKQIERFFQWVF